MMQGERGRGEAGMVSAELAVGLVTLLLVLSLVLGAVRTGMDRAAGVSAAGALAREIARDGEPAAVWSQARQGLPHGSGYAVAQHARSVTVTVTVPVRGPLLRLLIPSAEASALAVLETP